MLIFVSHTVRRRLDGIMAAPIESITSKQQSNKQNCNDVSDVERIIADIFIDDDVVAAAAAADAIAEDEDDVINTVDTVKQTENCSSNSSKSDCDEIDSSIPPGFNDIDHIFHIDFMRSMQSLISQQEKRYVMCPCRVHALAYCVNRCKISNLPSFFSACFRCCWWLDSKMVRDEVVRLPMKRCAKSKGKIEYYWTKYWRNDRKILMRDDNKSPQTIRWFLFSFSFRNR